MLSKIQTKSIYDLFESVSKGFESLDIFLCESEQVFSETQTLLDNEKTFSVVTLEDEDLHDQQSILDGLYQVFFEELPSDSLGALEIIEALEDEVGEIQSCLLVVDNFSDCNHEAQASLLELVIVSKAFKLLLKIDDKLNFEINENLWGVLLARTILLNDQNFESNVEASSSETSQRKEQGVKAWYQLIPFYHLSAAIVLVLLVIGLWNMDFTQKKQEKIDLSAKHQDASMSNDVNIEHIDRSALEQAESSEQDLKVFNETIDESIIKEENNAITNKKSNLDVAELEVSEKQVPQKKISEAEKKVKADPVKNQSKTPAQTYSGEEFDWSPYQSNVWIKGLNKKYFTLQLMASYDASGIRNFLNERGVNSQYAVYTTQKNGKPWHVIIYGAYETHDSANLARNNLPGYLKSYSPWIRTVADIQNSLK
jgi:hypothetical protein